MAYLYRKNKLVNEVLIEIHMDPIEIEMICEKLLGK
jgi:hypothetical protein